MKEDRSCWECIYNKIGRFVLLGKCQERNLKHIPPRVVDIGCSRWKSKSEKAELKQLSLV